LDNCYRIDLLVDEKCWLLTVNEILKKLNFHFNLAFTAVNLAKTKHWLTIPKQDRRTLSMADVKTVYHNQLLLDKFLELFAINPNARKNKDKIRQFSQFGTIAA